MRQIRLIGLFLGLTLTCGVMAQGGPRGGMPPGGAGQTSEYDYEKQQAKYDKKMRKLLSDEQYDGYLKLKPQFASQRRIRDFLIGSTGENFPKPLELTE